MPERSEGAERKRHWKQWTKEEAEQTLAEWKASGLSLTEFARQTGVAVSRLRRWHERLGEPAAKGKKKGGKATRVRLVPATVNAPLVDLGLGADVSIRFSLSGPVLDVMNVNAVSPEWLGRLLAVVTLAMWSER